MSSASGRGQRVWVVDDDPALRRRLAPYLGEQGYEVRTLLRRLACADAAGWHSGRPAPHSEAR